MLVISPTVARRLAITRQRLSGAPPSPGAMLEMIRDLGCLQLDPISAVARSHLLVLWSRLGSYDPAQFEALIWQQRQLFEFWAHCASLVLTEDYQIHRMAMDRFRDGDGLWERRTRAWVAENHVLHDQMLERLRQEGPLLSRQFSDTSQQGWRSTGWTSERNVSRMLDILWLQGTILVAGRVGGQKLWDLAERCLPDWTPTTPLDERAIVLLAAQRSLRALGVAKAAHIQNHFTRGRYPGLAAALAELEAAGTIVRAQIIADGNSWPGPWYIHRDDLPLVETLANHQWQPRTTLLSPFDNLICDRARTEQLFGFRFRIEIYVPKAKRQYGYYVLPILHGDQLIGRVDPLLDRAKGRLLINAVYAEPEVPLDGSTGAAVAGAIGELASFLGVNEIVYGGQVPAEWRLVKHS